MKYNFNRNLSIIAGRVASEPSYQVLGAKPSFDTGNSLMLFTVASNRLVWRDDGTPREETLFVECQAWNGAADKLKETLRKGSEIEVTGHLKSSGESDQLSLVVESFMYGPNFYDKLSPIVSKNVDKALLTIDEEGYTNYNK